MPPALDRWGLPPKQHPEKNEPVKGISRYGNLVAAYVSLGKLSEAIEAGEKAIKLVPNYPDTHKNLGIIYSEQGQAAEALAQFEIYLQLAPDAPDRAAVEEEIANLTAQIAASSEEAASQDSQAGTEPSPESVVQVIFDAAQSGNFASLKGLCDPQDENDDDTQMICDLATDDANREGFVQYFAKGKINGEATISPDGTQAEVPFLFGPDGDSEETMELINRDGQWYLFGF